jgi:orotidine-5'-phosphate decarboxylase
VALDVPTLSEATTLARRVAPHVAAVKIGSQLFTAEGPRAVHAMRDLGLRLFLDLKFHDIPSTVAGAIAAASALGVWMVNVHASGGTAMMRAAVQAGSSLPERPLILGVTVLTSLDEAELQAALGTARSLREQVRHLARQSQEAGLDGVVASPHEIAEVRQAGGADFLIVTPGVRPAESGLDDQRRVLTPGEAIRAGADYVVVGRPILTAADPLDAARRIAAECGEASGQAPAAT